MSNNRFNSKIYLIDAVNFIAKIRETVKMAFTKPEANQRKGYTELAYSKISM
jgi:hypothetical protein